jgi:hypothetical protein
MNARRASEFIEAVTAWASSRKMVNVEVLQDHSPRYAPEIGDDYRLIWEITFTPLSLSKAYLKVSVSENGNPAVGIEKWQRIATRLDLRCSHTSGMRFAAGFEPERLADPQTLVALCETVSRGMLTITAYSIFSRLVQCATKIESAIPIRLRIGPADLYTLRALNAVGLAHATELPYTDWESRD